MEFPFSVGRFLSDKEQATGLGIAVYTAARFKGLQQALREKLSLIIDEMGEASAIAQDLKKVITNTEKLVASEDRLYMAFEGQNKAMGVLRMGKKRLFIRDEMGSISEIAPLCCLDFYVHESCQRKGVGKALFEFMLQCEHSEPSAIGYDRPSHKLLAFLEKHYRLYSYVPQANNFVVFKDYFQQHNPLINDKRSRQQLQQQMESANDTPQRGRRDISKSLASPSSPRYESDSHESGAAVSRRNAQLSVSHVFPSSASVEKMNAAQSNGPSPYRDRQRGNNDGYATIRPNQNQSAFSEDNFPAVVSNRGVFKREQNALDKQFQDCDIFGNPARRVPPSRGGNSLSRAGYSTIGVPSASTRDRETRYDSRALPSEFSQAYREEASLESYSKPSSPMALPIGKQGYMDSGKNDDSLSSLLTARRSVAPADEYFPEQRSRASTQREHVSDLFQSASENQNARFGGTTMRGGPSRRTAF